MEDNLIDDDALNQLLEMDEDEQHEFSREILQEFFEQLRVKVPQFDTLLANRDFDSLSKLAHFLKGSSAGVGALRIRQLCDQMQHFDKHTSEPDQFFAQHIADLKRIIGPTRTELARRVGL